MQRTVNEPESPRTRAAAGQVRLGVMWFGGLVIAVGLMLIVVFRWRSPSAPPPTAPLTSEVAPTSAPVAVASEPVRRPMARAKPAPEPEPALVSPPASATPSPAAPDVLALPAPTPEARQLVAGLTGGDPFANGVSEEAIAQWKSQQQRLVQQGVAGVAAIREFLQQKTGTQFGTEGWQALGYRSGREAMIDVLQQIGGAEAVGVTRETLRGATDPREVALLAKSLETQAPEVYRGEILAAAREAIAKAAQGEPETSDVGPVFEVFEKYGGAEAVGDLQEAAKQWRYYATLTLGQLPDGAGIPALVNMANETTSPSIAVLDTLASLSTRSEEARSAFLEQVRANRIPSPSWPALVQALTGDEMQVADSVFDRVLSRVTGEEYSSTHIGSGNQNFYWAPTTDTLTPEQIAQQVALIDEIQAAAGNNPAALEALQQARTVLDRRLARVQPAAKPQGP